jgi:hypothetical protein
LNVAQKLQVEIADGLGGQTRKSYAIAEAQWFLTGGVSWSELVGENPCRCWVCIVCLSVDQQPCNATFAELGGTAPWVP